MMERLMFKFAMAALTAAALIAAPAASAFAQAQTEKSDTRSERAAKKTPEKKAERKLTVQQQKMKDCGAKWQSYKKEKNVSGRTEYRKFVSGCLKG